MVKVRVECEIKGSSEGNSLWSGGDYKAKVEHGLEVWDPPPHIN